MEVKGIGPLDAPLWLIGEAPGANEEKEGKPFVGLAGKTLSAHLAAAGIDRSEVRLDNVCHMRPKANKFNNLTQEQVVKGTFELRASIREHKPTLVVALGNHPLEALVGKTGVLKRRGSIYWSDDLDVKVLSAYHPSYVMRNYKESPLLLFDLRKAARESKFKDITSTERTFILDPSLHVCLAALENFRTSPLISFDLETTRCSQSLPALPHTIAIASSPHEAICIPFHRRGGNCWSIADEAAIVRALNTLMNDPTVGKIAHNSMFDMGVLEWTYGIKTRGLIIDTMAAFHTLYLELPKALDTVMSIYTDQPYYGDMPSQGEESFWKYNCLDAMLTFEIADKIEQEMVEFEVAEFYHKIINPLILTLHKMQMRGTKIDLSLREKATLEMEAKLSSVKESLEAFAGYELNVNSPKQLGIFLYDELGMKPKYKRGTKTRTTDKEALASLRSSDGSVVFELIERARHFGKTISTYLKAPLVKGRMHCSYNVGGRVKDEKSDVVAGPSTGRLSSSMNVVVGSGTNLQNFPKGVCREMFIPDNGKMWMRVDLAQAENRVVAWLAEEDAMMEAFKSGKDIHKLVASWLYEKDIEGIEDDERQFAKKNVHGLNYLEGPNTFARLAGIPVARSKEIIATYFSAFPNVKAWHVKVEAELRRTRTLTNPLGRKRSFFGRLDNTTLRQAVAFVPQSTVADTLNIALTRLDAMGVQVLLNVHDETDFQYDKGKLKETVKMVAKAFNIPLNIHGRTLLIPYEVEVGKNWNELEPVEE